VNVMEEKISLLSEMIAFAIVDNELHDREYDFLYLVSQELGIEKAVFLDLFSKRDRLVVIKEEFTRILHFYRLALLMHCDNVLHQQEVEAIHQIGIKMGINLNAVKRILKMMEESDNKMIDPAVLIGTFQEQHN
jgi:uncharacterized tellurite resistance protein B-like protein